MRVIKITALWCSGCLIMNKVWNQVLEQKNIETISLDYDMDEDEVIKYNPGKILPVFIFEKDGNILERVVGEKTVDEMLDIINKLGEKDEV